MPVEDLIAHVTTGTYPDDTTELLRLWSRLGGRERAAILAQVRAIAQEAIASNGRACRDADQS